MSYRTRHIIVTLPNATDEEVDAFVESIESHGEQARVTENGFSVEHAPDDARKLAALLLQLDAEAEAGA